MGGFLGTRADFLSDLLILALGVILPALAFGYICGRRRQVRLHRAIMIAIFAVVVLYVIVYETHFLLAGGLAYLESFIRVDRTTYYLQLSVHVAVAAVALVLGGRMIARANRHIIREDGRLAFAAHEGTLHVRRGYWELGLLLVTVLTGVIAYYYTFVR